MKLVLCYKKISLVSEVCCDLRSGVKGGSGHETKGDSRSRVRRDSRCEVKGGSRRLS